MSSDVCLSLKNLKKDFKAKQALKEITLTLEEGSILGLVGPNGAGKTTMIKLIMGLLHPTAGSIKIFGKDRDEMTRSELSEIGYVADEPGLYEFMTVRQIIAFNSGFYPKWNRERCDDLLSRLKLPQSEKIKHLSRGMKAQLSLVLALSSMPRLLILDEPLEGLDPIRRIEFLNLIIEDFAGREGKSVLISSHYLEELERIADKIAFLNDGRLVKAAPADKLKADEKTIRVVFQKEPPEELFKMPGIKDIKREGKLGFLITVENNFSEIYEACSRFPHYVLDIYHRNLEDLFRDYSGGDKA